MLATRKRFLDNPPPSRRPELAASAETTARDLPIRLEPVVDAKYLRSLERLIDQIRELDAHGKRGPFLDDVFAARLLGFFKPAWRTLRTIDDFSQTRQARNSTVLDFDRLADQTRLQPILDHLRAEIPKLKPASRPAARTLQSLHRQVLAVDGLLLKAAVAVARAIRRRGDKSRARLEFHVDARARLPEPIVIPEAGRSEAQTARDAIRPGHSSRRPRHLQLRADPGPRPAGRRIRDAALREPGPRCRKFDTIQTREPTAEARAAAVVSDRPARLAGSARRQAPDLVLIEVAIVSADDPEHPVRPLRSRSDLDV